MGEDGAGSGFDRGEGSQIEGEVRDVCAWDDAVDVGDSGCDR